MGIYKVLWCAGANFKNAVLPVQNLARSHLVQMVPLQFVAPDSFFASIGSCSSSPPFSDAPQVEDTAG